MKQAYFDRTLVFLQLKLIVALLFMINSLKNAFFAAFNCPTKYIFGWKTKWYKVEIKDFEKLFLDLIWHDCTTGLIGIMHALKCC